MCSATGENDNIPENIDVLLKAHCHGTSIKQIYKSKQPFSQTTKSVKDYSMVWHTTQRDTKKKSNQIKGG